MSVGPCVCTCVCAHACVYFCECMHLCVHLCVFLCICVHLCVCVDLCVFTYVSACLRVCTCICVCASQAGGDTFLRGDGDEVELEAMRDTVRTQRIRHDSCRIPHWPRLYSPLFLPPTWILYFKRPKNWKS